MVGSCAVFRKDLLVGCWVWGDLTARGALGLYPVWPTAADVDAVSNRLMSASRAASFLCCCGPVSMSSFVGTNAGRPAGAIKATGALWAVGVVGFNGIDGETCGVSLRWPTPLYDASALSWLDTRDSRILAFALTLAPLWLVFLGGPSDAHLLAWLSILVRTLFEPR